MRLFEILTLSFISAPRGHKHISLLMHVFSPQYAAPLVPQCGGVAEAIL